ncbi:N-formylglutamate amidohydrolase [Salinimicrobium soli]|uniref:N-formylglutamate amidohydrolase n=1 Tax=Salinimicrobium soli TaxID=1254399 RepID=UPI003AAD5092
MILVLTCEHAGNLVPEKFQDLFKGNEDELQTHRGFDPGALDLFKVLKPHAALSHFQMLSRLVIEMNRSLHSTSLFSEFSNPLPAETKQELLREYYYPYRNSVEEAIENYLGKGEEVLHLSVHTFTPQWKGEQRNADVGLLYDPKRKKEKEFCSRFKNAILERDPDLKIRFNFPYAGVADGFTTFLRKRFSENYLGIELEVNQKFVDNNHMDSGLKMTFSESISELLQKGN